MPFNSSFFVLIFFPLVVVGYFLAGSQSRAGALFLLLAASLLFYSWSDQISLLLLIASIVFNYGAGLIIVRTSTPTARAVTAAAVIANLLCLAYFKYLGFILENLSITDAAVVPPLPLGISFFTFTQIAFLVDSYIGRAKEYRPVHYALFVTYFPHLVAGPILHHNEMIPQFESRQTGKPSWQNIAAGLTIFSFGLFKKIIIADTFATYSDAAFANATNVYGVLDAWVTALWFGLQIYFDFSAYCDMAIGISLTLGIRLPVNFLSPYKSASIIEFWRTWHITLSRFLRDYLYIPLGGNRNGRRHVNLILTMLLGGLWHGASWNFVIWGGLHGFYLGINHVWRRTGIAMWRPAAIALTFGVVTFAWVFFRAETMDKAQSIAAGMIGLHGLTLPASSERLLSPLSHFGVQFGPTYALGGVVHLVELAGGLFIVLALPNIAEVFAAYQPALGLERVAPAKYWAWRPTWWWCCIATGAAAVSVIAIADFKPFIYFQF